MAVLREAEILIIVKRLDNDSAQVEAISDEGCEFGDFVCAAEYMLWLAAKKCDLPFDEAIKKLTEGAHTYRSLVIPITDARE